MKDAEKWILLKAGKTATLKRFLHTTGIRNLPKLFHHQNSMSLKKKMIIKMFKPWHWRVLFLVRDGDWVLSSTKHRLQPLQSLRYNYKDAFSQNSRNHPQITRSQAKITNYENVKWHKFAKHIHGYSFQNNNLS